MFAVIIDPRDLDYHGRALASAVIDRSLSPHGYRPIGNEVFITERNDLKAAIEAVNSLRQAVWTGIRGDVPKVYLCH